MLYSAGRAIWLVTGSPAGGREAVGAWRAAALAVEFGFSVVGSLVGGVIAGLYLDRQLGTAPAFFLTGIAAGFVFSIYLIYVIYRVQVQGRRGGAAAGRSSAAGGRGGAAARFRDGSA